MLFLLATLATSAAAHPEQGPPTDLVRVDVVVTDADNRPVTGLRVEDFELLDEGRPQRIVEFRPVSIPVTRRDADVKAPREGASAEGARAFVLVIDDRHLNVTPEQVQPLRELLVDFIRRLSPNDRVATVFTSRREPQPIFSRDLAAQIEGVSHLRELLAPISYPRSMNEEDLRATLGTLRAVCGALEGSDDVRRAILYVSQGAALPLDRSGPLQQELEETFDAARRANVVVYTLDPRALLTISGFEDAGQERTQQAFLKVLAERTGGRAAVDRSRVKRIVDEILAENSRFYMLGYDADPIQGDGRFRRIEVRVKRPNVRVQARQGYVARGPIGRVDAEVRVEPHGPLAPKAPSHPRHPRTQGTLAPRAPRAPEAP